MAEMGAEARGAGRGAAATAVEEMVAAARVTARQRGRCPLRRYPRSTSSKHQHYTLRMPFYPASLTVALRTESRLRRHPQGHLQSRK